MDFGSDLQLIVINLECMVSIGTSMLFVSPLTGFSVLMKFWKALVISGIWYQGGDAPSCYISIVYVNSLHPLK